MASFFYCYLLWENKKLSRNLLSTEQGYKDSNLEMTESESVALPFGDSPMYLVCPRHE